MFRALPLLRLGHANAGRSSANTTWPCRFASRATHRGAYANPSRIGWIAARGSASGARLDNRVAAKGLEPRHAVARLTFRWCFLVAERQPGVADRVPVYG